MADVLTRTGPLDGWAGRFAELPDSVTIRAEPFHAMASVRGETTLAAHTWTRGERVDTIWLGPDEVLLTSPFVSAAELGGVDVSAQRTTIRLRGAHARDVLETGCAIDLHPRSFPPGSAAVTMLAQAGVILLNDSEMTEHGAPTSPGDNGSNSSGISRGGRGGGERGGGGGGGGGGDYRILVRSSFAPYLAEWLLDAATEFRP